MSHRGFTLIEVLVVIVLVAILASVAVPSYTAYVQRSRVAQATSTLAAFAARMENAYGNNGNYGAGACAVAAPQASDAFAFACTVSSDQQAFTATATGTGVMSGYAYAIDQRAARTTTAFPGRTDLPAACWLASGTEC